MAKRAKVLRKVTSVVVTIADATDADLTRAAKLIAEALTTAGLDVDLRRSAALAKKTPARRSKAPAKRAASRKVAPAKTTKSIAASIDPSEPAKGRAPAKKPAPPKKRPTVDPGFGKARRGR